MQHPRIPAPSSSKSTLAIAVSVAMLGVAAWAGGSLSAQPGQSRSGRSVSERDAIQATTTCLRCHGMPDPAVAGDRLWISRIATTRCVAQPAPASDPLRQALQRYMSAETSSRPTRVDAKSPDAGSVAVSSNIVRGSILLEPFDPTREARGRGKDRTPATIDRSPKAQPASFRLVWTGRPEEKRARSIPPGRYRVRMYRLLRVSEDGKLWQIWGSGTEGLRVTAEAGKPLHIAISDRPRITGCIAKKSLDPLRFAGAAHGDRDMGITIMDGNERTRATYRILSQDGTVVASGTLEYG